MPCLCDVMAYTFGEVRSTSVPISLFNSKDLISTYLPTLENWEKAKTMTECYDYLFEIAVKMKMAGLDPAAKPPNEPDYE